MAKSIIKQFDVPRAYADEVLDDAAKELAALAVDLDIEEWILQESQLDEGDGDDDNDDNLDGWSNVHNELSDEEWEGLDNSLQPVHLVLVKVYY